MRILMTTDAVGGVWTFTQELAAGLMEAGCGIVLVSLGRLPSRTQQEWANGMQRRWGRRFHLACSDAPLEWMQANDGAYAHVQSALLRMVEKFDIDLLHCNQFCFGALPVHVPKVITAHSDVLSWARCCRGSALDKSEWLHRYIALVERGIAGAQAVVAPTRWMLEALSENFQLPKDCSVIANGRSLQRSSVQTRKLQAITAGRLWDEAKNIRLLAKVSSPVPLLVAGDSLCETASAPPISGELSLLGPLAEEELHARFCESDLYLCPSLYEPFGLAPLEAALCGCAILANDIASLREVWQEGALYFHDAASLSELLCRLQSDRELLAKAQARSFAQAKTYTREKMASAYLALFQQMLTPHQEIADVA